MNQSFLMSLNGGEFKAFLREALTEILGEVRTKANQQNVSDLMSIKEAATFLKLKKSTLYEKTAMKLIPHIKKGNRLYFKRAEIERWLCDGKVKTQKELEGEAATYTMQKPLRK